ncbi:MAG: hypothetical protein ACR2OJ_04280 [Hyphomicrobiales bacterium]
MLGAVIVLPSPDEYETDDYEAVPVEIVDIDEISKRTALSKDSPEDVKDPGNKPVEDPVTKAPQNQEIAPNKVVSIPEPAAEPEPPTPKQEEPKPQEETPKEPEKVEPKPADEEIKQAAKPVPPKPRTKPKPPKKVAQKKHKFDADDIAALLNKSQSTGAPQKDVEKIGTPKKADVNAQGEDDVLSANEIDWLRQRISSCWNVPIGVVDAERLRVTLDFQLDINGNVVGAPQVVAAANHPLANIAVESGTRAVMTCQPYDRLDKSKHESWERIRMHFDLKDMINS